jgi:ribonuclease P protein subunit RPR2
MPERSRGQRPAYQTGIAKERMDILLRLARKEAAKHSERSRRYALLARKIGMRYNVRLTPEWKRVFCKSCGALLPKGRGATIKCPGCERIYRRPVRRGV